MSRVWLCALAAAVLLTAGEVRAQEVERAATPSWVRPLARDEAAAPVDASPIRILAMDQQVRFTPDGVDTYTFRRYRVQTTQGLGMLSTVSAVWSPPRETVQVHSVRILRGDQVIDVLDGQQFELLRRESNLENSMLDGSLTATLQPRDLRVGDILETAFTIHDSGGVLAPHRELLDGLNSGMVVDHYRMRASWPDGMPIRVQGIGSWSDAAARPDRSGQVLEIDKRDLQPRRMPDDLPARFYFDRTVQFTDFANWSQASALMAPLYLKATTLEPGSPLTAEIERIRAENPTAEGQAAAALRLVQEQIRYVALSMGAGNYTPASADDVWRARYGDCKGKTALLLALLHGLGIEAEGALVSTQLGDGLDTRLPLLSWFDHIIVRASIGGRIWWLDGTRVGDRDLASITPPPYHWALPVRDGAVELEKIVVPPAERAVADITLTVDTSEGLDAPAKMEMDWAMTGDAATAYRERVSTIPPEQLETMLKSSMQGDDSYEVTAVGNRFDDATNTFHLTMSGTTRMAWVAGSGGRLLAVDGSTLTASTQAERKGLFVGWKEDPYSNAYPIRTRMHTRIILPNGGAGFRIEGGDQTVESGGYRLERTAAIVDGVADVVMISTSLTPEVSAADMAAARTRNENLSNAMVRVRAPAGYQATEADKARMEAADSDVEDLIKRAERLTQSEDLDGALALLDAALQKSPDDAKALRTRGSVRMTNDDYAGARADYDHAVDLDPADIDALVGQGNVALRDGRAADAVISYSVALRLDPANLTGLWGRAVAYYQIGRYDRALADYRALKTSGPDVAAGPSGELRALYKLNRLAEARTLIEAMLAKSPTDRAGLNGLVWLAKLEGKPAGALPALDAAVAASPDAGDLLALRARARVRAADAEGARADFAAVRTLANGDPVLLNNLCWAEGLAGFDLETALADCDAAIAGAEESSFIDSRALVLLQMDRYAEARAAYDKALEGEPNQTSSLYGRGLARLAMGDAAGREDMDKARARSFDVADNFGAFTARHPELSQ
jgi:tetratricopeptide (TPR) repeat protein